jgi:hypothetical protein
MKQLLMTVVMLLMAGSVVRAQVELKSETDLKKFAGKNFEFSMSHKYNAGQTRNVKMSGQIIDKPEFYKDVKKIAVLGVTVAFTSRDGSASADAAGYAGIPARHFRELADSILEAIYRGFESEGYAIVGLDQVMKAPSYRKLDFGSSDEGTRYSDNSWVATALDSKWMEPEKVNTLKSGISFVHADTLKARAMLRNKPLQDVTAEVGADAGINIAIRFNISGSEFRLGWGSLKRGMVADLIPAAGDPRIVWSSSLKSDVDLGIKIKTFDKKTTFDGKSWKYNLAPSIPALSDQVYQVMRAVAFQLKTDQSADPK